MCPGALADRETLPSDRVARLTGGPDLPYSKEPADMSDVMRKSRHGPRLMIHGCGGTAEEPTLATSAHLRV